MTAFEESKFSGRLASPTFSSSLSARGLSLKTGSAPKPHQSNTHTESETIMATTLKDIRDFFDIPLSQFSKEWKALPQRDRDQIKQGLEDGTLTY